MSKKITVTNKKHISPARAMNYAEIIGTMPPRYQKGKRYYDFTCEGELYIVDVLKNEIPSDMYNSWGVEVNTGAVEKYNGTKE